MSQATPTTQQGAPPTWPVARRLLVPSAIFGLVLGLTLPLLLGSMLDLDADQLRFVRRSFGLGMLVTFLAIALGMRVALRGVARSHIADVAAQRRVLRLPARLAALTVMAGTSTTLLALNLRMLTARDPAWLLVGVALATTAFVGFMGVPVYVGARAVLLPHALFFAQESLPSGRRMPIGLLLGYGVLSVATLALVPATIFGNARLVAAQDRADNARALATARRLAHASAGRSVVEAVRLCTHTPLLHATAIVRLPSGDILPEEAATSLAGLHGEEAALEGDLRGGVVRVIPQPVQASRLALALLVLGLLALSVMVAISLARAVTRDARNVTRQVEALAAGETPDNAPTVSVAEVRRVALAVNRLLDRIPRLQLEKFLAVERAEESRRAKAMFLANMSHDLRSPLNSILGFSELLTRGLEGPITDGQRTLLDDIHATGSHLLRLLSEILDTARAESGHLDLQRRSTPPATFVTQARKEALRGRPESVADKLTIDLQAGVAPVHVDALRMQQALTHTLSWAIDAAQDRPVRVESGDRDRPAGRAFVIEVSCDRPTTEEEEAQLFQPFRKVEGVPGLHLALPLARRLVEAHAGTLEPFGPDTADESARRLGVRIVLPRLDSTRDSGQRQRLGSRPAISTSTPTALPKPTDGDR